MKIIKAWLINRKACKESVELFCEQKETNSIKILNLLIAKKKYAWANWLITQLLKRKQLVQYAVYAAEQVLPIFEKKYPNDNRPRLAIKAAKKCSKHNTKKNRNKACLAAAEAYTAANETNLGYTITKSTHVVYATANSADVAYVVHAIHAIAHAYNAATNAFYATTKGAYKNKIKILNYGIKLLN